MQKTTLGIALLMSSCFGAFANPVSVQTAQTAATNFIAKKISGTGSVNVQLTKTYAANGTSGQSSIYIFDVNNGAGFVIVSGEDAVTPILAYSAESNFPVNVTNKEVAYWMDGYNEQITTVIDNHVTQTTAIGAEWSKLVGNTNDNDLHKGTTVAPLLTTKWDQGDAYANLCPTNTPTGCVATAMAQIMKFWNYPTQGTGTHTYNAPAPVNATLSADFGATTYMWNNMPNMLTNTSPAGQKAAIATLMSHCGISVNMGYNYASNGGSGAYVISGGSTQAACTENALKNFFGYSTDIKGLARAGKADADWIKMLQDELDAGRPILYTGFSSDGGHAFVFDGYDGINRFHVNWGWSGASDGFFIVNNLAPAVLGIGGGGGGGFNNGQQALTKIIPSNVTKIVDVPGADRIATYPNPVANQLNIDLTQFDGKVTAVQLFNIQGQKVLAQDIKGTKATLPVSQVAQGMYLLHLQSDKGTIIRKVAVVK